MAIIWATHAAASICVLVPHFKDEYWVSVGYGLDRAAQAQGVVLSLHEAGGYRATDQQVAQIDECLAKGAEVILIGAVQADDPALLAALARAAKQVPVVGLVNALDFPGLSGQIGVDWAEMGRVVGLALADRFSGPGQPVPALLISGPEGFRWAVLVEAGLRQGLAGSRVQIVGRYGSDTGLHEQFETLVTAIEAHPEAQVVIGSAPAIEAAMGYLAAHPDDPRPLLAATYLTHSVKRGIASGQVALAPFDDPIGQGEMAIALVTAIARGQPAARFVGPPIRLITQPIAHAPRLSSPDYFPDLKPHE